MSSKGGGTALSRRNYRLASDSDKPRATGTTVDCTHLVLRSLTGSRPTQFILLHPGLAPVVHTCTIPLVHLLVLHVCAYGTCVHTFTALSGGLTL